MRATKLTAEQQAKKDSNEFAIRNAVVEGYLETGKCLDAKDIAARLKWSESKVRRVLDEAHGAPNGIMASQDHRESFSKYYRSFQSGAHKVWVYAPALWLLRDMLNAERQANKVVADMDTWIDTHLGAPAPSPARMSKTYSAHMSEELGRPVTHVINVEGHGEQFALGAQAARKLAHDLLCNEKPAQQVNQ